MNTIIKKADKDSISEAVALLQNGEIVAIPTETVYGLAANALNPAAIEKIFTAKGRPRDNPLIVHVTDLEMARGLGLEIPPLAEELAERFWTGADFPVGLPDQRGSLTMILKKINHTIPTTESPLQEVSCGLDTVAVRVPNHAVALEIIKLCELPLAAPSANISGSPSPTKAEHVFADLSGKIPLIIDGGACEIGLESTVIAFEEREQDSPAIRILRPGAVTAEDLSEFADIKIDKSVIMKTGGTSPPRSPGTAYKHYAPKAQVIAVTAENKNAFVQYVAKNAADGAAKLDFCETEEPRLLFTKLRELDELGVKRIFVRLPKPEGIGLAVCNRLIRAADYNVIQI